MPKRILEMTAIEVARLREDGDHSVGGVSGLYLQIIGASRCWMLRYTHLGKRKRMGLGIYPTISLAVARDSARAAAALVQTGIDPKRAREDEREAARMHDAKQLTFKQAGEAFIKEHEPGWKNLKHIDQWKNTLATYAYPKIGKLLLSQIDQAYVLQVISPIWSTKTETASRMRGRIEQILDWATVHGHRSGVNPARWRGQLEYLLPNPDKVAPIEHHEAVPYEDLPQVYKQLCAIKGQAARALRFVIFTAGRSGEVRGMKWQEVDLFRAVWTIPGERMKSGREHRVVLPPQAVEFLRNQPRRKDREDLVFPSPRGTFLSDSTLSKLMRDHKINGVPHGFRSTFRDWAGETTHHPRDAIELCIAHVIDNKTEAAYRRGDMIKKRVAIMKDWADYATSETTNPA
ncbi:tyrosine-type recombinase/integrase [Diaphorobacter caeni]|uniref:tyrosine-type recombinase/integrase n=1 Tax=Diaphorobacter caeni TaxID=2784387 RepID=UPI00188FD7E3|nr:site-specific integrase [Diaphorobacter caeni]MBF5006984.1 integrase arm-type DNA-binding domain-containing protein [Diaphorobacter caeni]